MGRIQSNIGLVSGINIEDTVNQLMQLNSIPKTRLEDRNKLLDQERVATTELMTLIVGVQLTTDRLGLESLFDAVQVNSSNSSLLSATASGSPAPGTYNFTPVRLAQTQQLASSTFASSDQQLAAGEIKIHTGGFLDRSVSLEQLNGGTGVSRGFISIRDRSGAVETIDLRFAQTVQDVVDSINAASSIKVTASIDGNRIQLNDLSGGVLSNLEVNEVSGGTTAADLGLAGISVASNTATGTTIYQLTDPIALRQLRDGRGLDFPDSGDALSIQLQDGTSFNVALALDSNSASLGQLLDAIETASNGKVDARIAGDGLRIEIADLTSGTSTFSISSPNGDLAAQLGLDNPSAGGTIQGDRLIAGLDDVLLSSLNGGTGFNTLGAISITDRSGASDTIDLSGTETLNDLIDRINAASVGVTARLNRTRTGLEIVDTTGGTSSNLIVADADASNSATQLGIAQSVADDILDSGSLRLQFVSRNTLLSEFNQGQGVALGTIEITDASGVKATLNLVNKQPTTIGDVLDELNGLGLGITAKINDAGDGILIVDSIGSSGTLTIKDVGGGSAATDLGIAGTETAITDGGVAAEGIDGSRTFRVTTTSSTSLNDLVASINALSGAPVGASLLNTSGGGGVRILLNSAAAGRLGRVAVDGADIIGFTETSAAQDALVAFGATSTTGGLLLSSSDNRFEDVVDGLDITINGTSSDPVAVTVSQTEDKVADQINQFVEQYNKLRDKYENLTIFNAETNQVGILFGRSSALRVDTTYGRLLTGTFPGASSIASLAQLGIRLNDQGRLEFDRSKFSAQYSLDPAAVKSFFTAENVGFSAKAKAAADSLAGIESGALLQRSNTLTTQIESNSKRIAALEIRLNKQRERLLTQFYNMETVLARIQQDLNALNQLQILPPLTA